jgi:hypothetical protein
LGFAMGPFSTELSYADIVLAFVTFSRTAIESRFGATPIAPSLRKPSASFSSTIPFKTKTGGRCLES